MVVVVPIQLDVLTADGYAILIQSLPYSAYLSPFSPLTGVNDLLV